MALRKKITRAGRERKEMNEKYRCDAGGESKNKANKNE
jgi:hypothetical protein